MITNEVTAVKISTPCTRKCKLINDHCVGCGRTWQQIRDWILYEESQRISIMNDLKPNIQLKKQHECW